MEKHYVSERRACRALNLNRSGVRYKPVKLPDEDALTEAIIALGYRPPAYQAVVA